MILIACLVEATTVRGREMNLVMLSVTVGDFTLFSCPIIGYKIPRQSPGRAAWSSTLKC